MNEPLISIIIPVYNVEKYIRKCLDSVLNQTYKNIEIIIINDGSTDNTYSICIEYEKSDSRIKLFTQENSGQGAARNLGLQHAQGTYIGFVDGDDYIDPDMYETMIKQAENLSAELVICGLYYNNNITIKKSKTPSSIQVWDNYQAMLSYLSDSVIFTGPVNKLYRKSLFIEIKFPIIRCREDAYIMHHIISQCKKVVHIAESKYTVNLRPESTEGKPFNMDRLVILDVAEDVKLLISKRYPTLLEYAEGQIIQERIGIINDILLSNLYKEYREICDNQRRLLTKLSIDNYKLRPGIDRDLYQILNMYYLYRMRLSLKGRIRKLKRYIIG